MAAYVTVMATCGVCLHGAWQALSKAEGEH